MSAEMILGAAVIVSVLLVGMAIGAIVVRSLASAVVFLSSLSLLASVLFLFVAAPDVAITEAAIGSGLTTLIFVLALYRTRRAPAEDQDAPMNRADEGSIAVRVAAAGRVAATDQVAAANQEHQGADTGTSPVKEATHA